jgi:hypothetical protein
VVNQFRIIGRKNDTNEISLNCQIKKNLIYNEATPTFHQWRYDGNVYGLNFPNQDEAQNFSKFMKRALDDVLGRVPFEDTDVYRPQASVASLHSDTAISHVISHVIRCSQPEPTHFTPTIAASSISSNRNGLGFDRIQITDRNYASNENNAVSLSQQIQNERSERLNPVENFNDELKRRLAGRSNFPSSNSDDLEKSNQATKNNSQIDSNPEMADIRQFIRSELSIIKKEVIESTRSMIRNEIRSISFDSNL